MLLHRHNTFTAGGRGEVLLCIRFGKILRMSYRFNANRPWIVVPPDRYRQAIAATSFEEIMALIRQ